MTAALSNIRVTASVGGKKTNRVKVRRRVAKSAGTALARYRKDPALNGLDVAITCISLPVAELAEIDAICERLQMARSHFLRLAAKSFAEKVRGS